jgi:hypothetical protein
MASMRVVVPAVVMTRRTTPPRPARCRGKHDRRNHEDERRDGFHG